MKSWIHELSESYVAGHKPVRKDLKENYVSLTEEQRFGLLSENVLAYLDEQLQNAYGIGIKDLNEQQLNSLFSNLFEYKGELEVSQSRGEEAGKIRRERLRKAEDLANNKEKGKPEDDVDAITGLRALTRIKRAKISDDLIREPNESPISKKLGIERATNSINRDSEELKYAKSKPGTFFTKPFPSLIDSAEGLLGLNIKNKKS